MPDTILYGSGVFKDAQGNIVYIQGLTQNDITKIKTYHTKVDTLETQVKALNGGQQTLAYKDYYTDDTYISEMAVGVYYNVPFNAQGQFLEFETSGENRGKPKNPQPVAEVTDLKVAYYELVFKGSDEIVSKMGRKSTNVSMEHVLYDNANATIDAEYTFNKDITLATTQDVDTLGDTKVPSAGWVRQYTQKKVTEAGHMTGKYYATGKPEEATLVTNEWAMYNATDIIA